MAKRKPEKAAKKNGKKGLVAMTTVDTMELWIWVAARSKANEKTRASAINVSAQVKRAMRRTNLLVGGQVRNALEDELYDRLEGRLKEEGSANG